VISTIACERRVRRALLRHSLALALTSILIASAANAEQAWVRGELTLNLRTGPGSQFRIIDAVKSGDPVDVLERGENWTHVRVAEGKQGWIPAGYLADEPPPTIRLAKLEEEVVDLRAKLDTATSEQESLKATNESLSSNDDAQVTRIAELERENVRLSAGQRWPEWITGGAMVAVGMALGWLWSRSAGRRGSPRIRL